MSFLIQFFIGGTVMVAAAYLSKSKYLFYQALSHCCRSWRYWIFTCSWKIWAPTISEQLKNGIFGAFGAVIFISSIFILTNWFKGGHAVIGAFLIYICYMIGCKCLLWRYGHAVYKKCPSRTIRTICSVVSSLYDWMIMSCYNQCLKTFREAK